MLGGDEVGEPLHAACASGRAYCKQHSSSVTPKKPPAQCMSMTEKGKQCENKPAEGRRYCSRHL